MKANKIGVIRIRQKEDEQDKRIKDEIEANGEKPISSDFLCKGSDFCRKTGEEEGGGNEEVEGDLQGVEEVV